MIEDFVDTMAKKYDKETLALKLPDAFDNLKGSDAKLEMIQSSTIQPVNLFYDHNRVTNSIAYIFVNT